MNWKLKITLQEVNQTPFPHNALAFSSLATIAKLPKSWETLKSVFRSHFATQMGTILDSLKQKRKNWRSLQGSSKMPLQGYEILYSAKPASRTDFKTPLEFLLCSFIPLISISLEAAFVSFNRVMNWRNRFSHRIGQAGFFSSLFHPFKHCN